MASEEPVELRVQVDASGADAEEVGRLTRDLLAELRELPVESAELASAGAPPPGTRAAGEAVAFGALAVSLLPKVFPKVVAFLQGWMKRGEGKRLRIKARNGGRSFEVDLPAGELSHEELRDLLATLSGTPAPKPPTKRRGS
jgi:hypothetical protein